ncbi:MAG: hypothetical protein K6G88_13950 [Lachnospiraceae bacterium]|nr:hypothetical protein [Lachnospiraceae bacterium]
MAKLFMSYITFTDYCINYAICSLGTVIFITILHLVSFEVVNIKKTLTRNMVSPKVIFLMEISVVLIIIATNMCLGLNVKMLHDSINTIKQNKIWEKLSEYNYFYILFREKELTNEDGIYNTQIVIDDEVWDKDVYCADVLYNKYLKEHRAILNIDLIKNGIHNEYDEDVSIIYANAGVKDEIEELLNDIDSNVQLKEDRYYIISKYSEEELRKNNIYDCIVSIDFEDRLKDAYYVKANKNYKWITYDIKMPNLADNEKKNPVIIYNPKMSGCLSPEYEMGALLKFESEDEFQKIINEQGINNGYSNYYTKKSGPEYLEKRKDKISQLIVNGIISIIMLVLFNSIFALVLKMEFDSRAEKIAISKVLGKGLIKRYMRVFVFLIIAFLVSGAVTFIIINNMDNFNLSDMCVGYMITIVNIIIMLIGFVENYEAKSIVKILKGGK